MDQIIKSEKLVVQSSGYLNGLLGVIIFSGSLPATKLAVNDFGPIFLTTGRASVAGFLALIVLLLNREKIPNMKQWISLSIVSLGVVIGFPLFSSLALQYITSAHSIVYVGLLPLFTAIFAVVFGGELPKPIFWVFSILGSSLVVLYALIQGVNSSLIGDLMMISAIILAGLGYAIGGKLSKVLGGWQVISWSLVLSLPVMLFLSFVYKPNSIIDISISSWLGLAYLSFFSMFIGFIFWYKGLAQGGIASVGQLQLLQPFFGLALSALILKENVGFGMILIVLGVILCVFGSKKFGSN